jgi:hypothetical protein
MRVLKTKCPHCDRRQIMLIGPEFRPTACPDVFVHGGPKR